MSSETLVLAVSILAAIACFALSGFAFYERRRMRRELKYLD